MSEGAAFRRYRAELEGIAQDENYAFATGRVKVLEGALLPSEKIAQLCDPATTRADFEAALNEGGYPAEADPAERIRLGMLENDRLLKELAGRGILAEGLLAAQDYHNLKVLLKHLREIARRRKEPSAAVSEAYRGGERELDADIPSYLKSLIYFESPTSPERLWEELKALLLGGPGAAASDLLKAAALEFAAWKSDYRPGMLELRLDAAAFAAMGALIARDPRSSEAIYLRLYRELMADCVNLQSALRLKRMRAYGDQLADAWLPGGLVGREALHRAFDAGVRGLEEAFADTAAERLLPWAEGYVKGKTTLAFGRELAELQLDFARLGLGAGQGVPQVAGYFLARRLEARNLRVAWAGMSNAETRRKGLDMLTESYRDEGR